jgi:hypothetical protein
MSITRVVILQPEIFAGFNYIGLDELVNPARLYFWHLCSQEKTVVSPGDAEWRVHRGKGRFVRMMTPSRKELQVAACDFGDFGV